MKAVLYIDRLPVSYACHRMKAFHVDSSVAIQQRTQ